jgi:hypothetical protein
MLLLTPSSAIVEVFLVFYLFIPVDFVASKEMLKILKLLISKVLLYSYQQTFVCIDNGSKYVHKMTWTIRDWFAGGWVRSFSICTHMTINISRIFIQMSYKR